MSFMNDWLVIPELRARVIARISNYIIMPNGCMLWQGKIVPKGYGQVTLRWQGDIAYEYVHRLAWELAHERRLWPGEQVQHTCDTPGCRAKEHLVIGVDQDNSDDKVARDRQPRGVTSYQSVLDEDDVRNIRTREHTFRYYAEKYGVAVGTIQDVMDGKTWRHVK